MAIRGVLIHTGALFFAIAGLIVHFLAIFGKQWIVAIPRQNRGPNDQAHYYSLWTRCQYSNTSFVIPDISSQPNIENFVCRPNTYLRYNQLSEDITRTCYESRHQCSSIIGVQPDCQCQYLTVTQIQQWCAILAVIFISLGIFVFYLRLITSAQNTITTFLLSFCPTIFLGFASILMILTMILVGVYLRRNEYEDYDIRLPNSIRPLLSAAPETFNLYRLNGFYKAHKDPTLHRLIVSSFKAIHNERFRAQIGWSADLEIIAIVSIFLSIVLSSVLNIAKLN